MADKSAEEGRIQRVVRFASCKRVGEGRYAGTGMLDEDNFREHLQLCEGRCWFPERTPTDYGPAYSSDALQKGGWQRLKGRIGMAPEDDFLSDVASGTRNSFQGRLNGCDGW